MITESLPLHKSAHLFAVCNAGSEKLLKADVAGTRKELHPAFMRPQLVTWKAPEPVSRPVQSLFARVAGLSLGMFSDGAEMGEVLAPWKGMGLHLHVFPRETPEDGLTPEDWQAVDARTEELRASLLAQEADLHEARPPREGEWVLDVVLDVSPDGKFLAGVHRHTAETHPCAGALPRIHLPAEVPSRAWLKMEQALVYAGLGGPGSLRGSVALELGSAPGGASLSLLQHGASVLGVDAARMDRRVLEFESAEGAKFTHFKMNAGQVPRALLPARVDVLTCDLNAAPPVILPIVEKYQKALDASCLILTMKLGEAEMVKRIPEFMRRLRGFAPAPVRAVQLAANRSEFCVVAGVLAGR